MLAHLLTMPIHSREKAALKKFCIETSFSTNESFCNLKFITHLCLEIFKRRCYFFQTVYFTCCEVVVYFVICWFLNCYCLLWYEPNLFTKLMLICYYENRVIYKLFCSHQSITFNHFILVYYIQMVILLIISIEIYKMI